MALIFKIEVVSEYTVNCIACDGDIIYPCVNSVKYIDLSERLPVLRHVAGFILALCNHKNPPDVIVYDFIFDFLLKNEGRFIVSAYDVQSWLLSKAMKKVTA